MKWARLLSSVVPCIAALCIGWSPAGYAQGKYPVRPLRFLIPFPAGGAADTIARTIAEPLSAQLGQPIVIDNRPGAGGRLAAEMLAKAEPDGYTLLVGTLGAISISPALYKNLPYNMERDFLPLTRVGEILNVMVVNPSTGAKSVKDFIDWAKKRNGNVRFGSSGAGQPDHLAGVFFERLAGIDMVHVPYKGGGPALVDLISGDIQVMFSTYVVALAAREERQAARAGGDDRQAPAASARPAGSGGNGARIRHQQLERHVRAGQDAAALSRTACSSSSTRRSKTRRSRNVRTPPASSPSVPHRARSS